MKAIAAALVVSAALGISVAAAGATPIASTMKLTCKVAPGMTRVTNITDARSHFRFQWWYANGTTWKASAWIYYAGPTQKGGVYIPTHGHPVRAMATMHRENGTLVRVKAVCTK